MNLPFAPAGYAAGGYGGPKTLMSPNLSAVSIY